MPRRIDRDEGGTFDATHMTCIVSIYDGEDELGTERCGTLVAAAPGPDGDRHLLVGTVVKGTFTAANLSRRQAETLRHTLDVQIRAMRAAERIGCMLEPRVG